MKDVRTYGNYLSLDHKSKRKTYPQILQEISDHLGIKQVEDSQTKKLVWTWDGRLWK